MPNPHSHMTVAELWPLALGAEARLAGGAAGLGGTVAWVTALRAAFPLFPDLDEGHLALASPQVARRLDPRLTLGYLVRELAHAQAAGLVVDEAPTPEDVALADALALPLFALPVGADLRSLERAVLRALLDREGQTARREAELREHYQRLLAVEGVGGVLASLAHTFGVSAALCDAEGAIIAQASPVGAPIEPLTQGHPVRVAGKLLGELRLSASPEARAPLVALAARQAAEVCGLEMLQRAARQETEELLGADLVGELLDPESNLDRVASRLVRQGYDLSPGRRHVALALSAGDAKTSATLATTLARDLQFLGARDDARTLAVSYRELGLCLLSYAGSAGERRVRNWLGDALQRLPTARCCLGVSRSVHDLAGLRQAVEQALTARSLGQRIVGRVGPHYYEDLGLYRLLVGLRDQAELQRFYDETLGLLARYDRAHGTELVATLAAFFEQNANASQTARVLYVHRNTLNYRLQRIAEITGLDLDDAEARLALQLALKIHRLGP